MSGELPRDNTSTSEQTGWEALSGDTPELLISAEGISIKELNSERHRLQKEFYKTLNDKDKQAAFAEYVQTAKELHAKDPEVIPPQTEDYREEVIELYELHLSVNKKMADFKTRGMNQKDRARAEGTYDSNRHSVEVQSSRLYPKRIKALRSAIEDESVLDEDRAKDAAILDATRGLFKAHRDLRDPKINPQPSGIIAVQEYYRNRANAHNNMIRNLNELNEMCEKYGVTRFTYRNFMTNNPYATEKVDSDLHHRQEEDRRIVEQYFFSAFGEYSLDKSFDIFAAGGTISEDDGGKVNLFDDLYMIPEEAEDKEWVRLRQVQHLQRKRAEAAEKAKKTEEKLKSTPTEEKPKDVA
ncbi:hypothetical protein FWC63_03210 [Candidatus Saccharibacteria bacterium]|nr:hypothetical protein [Candidatus Saccharibacteria bacterium]